MQLAGGFASVHGLPLPLRLRSRAEAIGALNLFHRAPGAPPAADLALGQALADVATIGILSERAIRAGEVLNEQLQNALNSRVVIEQAKGVLAQRGGLDMNTAFDRLRRYARPRNLRLAEVARQVVPQSWTWACCSPRRNRPRRAATGGDRAVDGGRGRVPSPGVALVLGDGSVGPPKGIAALAEGSTSPVGSAARGFDDTMLSCTAEPYACPGGSIVLLRVAGEIDQLTHPALQAVLDAGLDGALDRTARHLVIDLAGVTFCCVRGFELLAGAAAAAAATGTGYAISGLPAHLERYARMLWADQVPIRRYRSAAVAVTTIRGEQATDHSGLTDRAARPGANA